MCSIRGEIKLAPSRGLPSRCCHSRGGGDVTRHGGLALRLVGVRGYGRVGINSGCSLERRAMEEAGMPTMLV